nr:hypothetical protein [Escherichia coli]
MQCQEKQTSLFTVTAATEREARAHQIEVICALAEDYPSMMTDSESGAIISLLKRLSGEVCVFLSDEQEKRRTLMVNGKNEGAPCLKC